jgi:hypothetical protein
MEAKKLLTFLSLKSFSLQFFYWSVARSKMVAGVGLELPFFGDVSTIRFSVASSPFFFLGKSVSKALNLAGSERNEQKMPHMRTISSRRILFRRISGRNTQGKSKMPQMRQHEELERWSNNRLGWRSAAFSLQGLWISFFKIANLQSFFYFSAQEVA